MAHRQIAGMEPTARERGIRGLCVFEVALHHCITPNHDLAHGFTVPGHLFHRIGVFDRRAFQRRVVHTLAGHSGRTLVYGKIWPVVLRYAYGCWTISFG